MMKPTQVAQNAARAALDPFETLGSQVAKPMLSEALNELGGFFGAPRGIGRNPHAIAGEDLARAREEKRLHEMEEQDNEKSEEQARQIREIMQEYKNHDLAQNKEQQEIKQEVMELTGEVVKLAKAAGVDTKVHLENMPKKIGKNYIQLLTKTVRTLREKAENSRSGSEVVSQRSNAKQTTGMNAWISGKQMKIHEQGTLQLQG